VAEKNVLAVSRSGATLGSRPARWRVYANHRRQNSREVAQKDRRPALHVCHKVFPTIVGSWARFAPIRPPQATEPAAAFLAMDIGSGTTRPEIRASGVSARPRVGRPLQSRYGSEYAP